MIDGKALEFIDHVDLYSMFANAMDNAIESVTKEEAGKRIIQVAGHPKNGLFLIRIRNYCSHPPVLSGSMPQTSKADARYHGYGLKSIRRIAEKYDGDIEIETGKDSFTLKIILPLPG